MQPIGASILRERAMVSSEQAESLIQDISRQKIKETMFSIIDNKSPGPDDFS